MSVKDVRVQPEKLTKVCDPEELGFETTLEVAPLQGTIGQERAISALELGLDIGEPGFNLFVSGFPGTGRNTALRDHVERTASTKPIPADWGYVHNFQEPSQPAAISLPCGMMKMLAQDMEDLLGSCRREIPNAFESDYYRHRMDEVMKAIQEERQAMTSGMEAAAREAGFSLSSTPAGVTPVPIREGAPMTQEDYGALPEEEREQLEKKAEEVQHSLGHAMAEIRRLNKTAEERSKEVDKEVVLFTLTPIIDELQYKYAEYPAVVEYLDQVEADMVSNLEVFKPREESAPQPMGMPAAARDEEIFVRYRVNDLVDNTTCEAAPVVFEHSPTYYNLFGRIDYQARMGTLSTDFTMIRAGSVHTANGGYLVLQARDLLTSPLSWETLKRTLRSREIRIENMGEQYSPLPSATLRPEPIPFNAKIVLVGSPDIFRALLTGDEDFRRYFKVTADFDC
jgi:predicted ATP-dependent protease